MWEHELSRYREQMVARGLASQTARRRGNLAVQMFGFLSAAGLTDLKDVTKAHVDAYLGYLASDYRTAKGRPISISHLRGHFLCAKDFFAWLVREGRILRSPYGMRQAPKVLPARLPAVLTPEETVRVLESADPRTLLGLRDRSMLELLYSTGMRKGELVALNLADFSFEKQEVVILKSKTRKGRVVPVGEYARHFTEAYIRTVRPLLVKDEEEKALFVSRQSGRRIAVRTVGQIVARAAKRSGVTKPVTPHTFRHSMATHMLRNRADLRHIQAILGHALITSTELYTHVSLEDLKEVVRRAHPHGRKGGESAL
jgi:integrase/recombinase XerD